MKSETYTLVLMAFCYSGTRAITIYKYCTVITVIQQYDYYLKLINMGVQGYLVHNEQNDLISWLTQFYIFINVCKFMHCYNQVLCNNITVYNIYM